MSGISGFCVFALALLFASCGGGGGGGDSTPAGYLGYVKASNTGSRDLFGGSVALSGDGNTLAVGAPFESSSTTGIGSTPNELAVDAGAVYVYTRSGGTWSQQAYVKASNTADSSQFGTSVALSDDGNTLAVGARFEAGAGAVYVFTRSGGTWSQQAYVKASNIETGDLFGWSVALSRDGNTLAVGAIDEDSGTTGVNTTPNELAPDSGAAYVFTRSAGSWSQQAYVKASNISSQFGMSIALNGDGNTLAVGSSAEGAVYVFTRITGTWSQQAYVKASNSRAGDEFGNSVALSGDGNTLAVGAPSESSSTTGINSTPDQLALGAGAVYVFTRSTGIWSQQAYVKASNTGAHDAFGGGTQVVSGGSPLALSGDGNTLAVGAPLESSSTTGINTTPNELAQFAGAVYVFTRTAGAWSQQAYVKASNTGAGDEFGNSVALSADGKTLAVGALAEDSSTTGVGSTPNESATNAGAVYVY